jgi:hypothetical protein
LIYDSYQEYKKDQPGPVLPISMFYDHIGYRTDSGLTYFDIRFAKYNPH